MRVICGKRLHKAQASMRHSCRCYYFVITKDWSLQEMMAFASVLLALLPRGSVLLFTSQGQVDASLFLPTSLCPSFFVSFPLLDLRHLNCIRHLPRVRHFVRLFYLWYLIEILPVTVEGGSHPFCFSDMEVEAQKVPQEGCQPVLVPGDMQWALCAGARVPCTPPLSP